MTNEREKVLRRNIEKAKLPDSEREWLLGRIEELEKRIIDDVKKLDTSTESHLRLIIEEHKDARTKLEKKLHNAQEVIDLIGMAGLGTVLLYLTRHGDQFVDQSALERLRNADSLSAILILIAVWITLLLGTSVWTAYEESELNKDKLDQIADIFTKEK